MRQQWLSQKYKQQRNLIGNRNCIFNAKKVQNALFINYLNIENAIFTIIRNFVSLFLLKSYHFIIYCVIFCDFLGRLYILLRTYCTKSAMPITGYI